MSVKNEKENCECSLPSVCLKARQNFRKIKELSALLPLFPSKTRCKFYTMFAYQLRHGNARGICEQTLLS